MSFLEVAAELLIVLLKTAAEVFLSGIRCVFPQPRKCVKDRVVLVTGAGGVLGRQIAQKLALLGAKVALVDVNEPNNLESLKIIRKMECKAWAFTCDVSNENQVEDLASKVRREVGDVDILVNNAGVLPGRPLLQLSDATIRKTMGVNVLAHMWTIRQFLPRMLEMGEGHIVAISSIAGILGAPNLVDYCASKHAVLGLMAALREELYEMGREDQIKLTTICPSTINTGLVQKPKTRFPWLLPILEPEDVSSIVVNSLLRNEKIVIIPFLAHAIFKVANLFPPQVPLYLQRFLAYTLDPNEDKS